MSDSIDNRMLDETQIQKYIYVSIPDISYEDMWKIRNRFIYDNVPLSQAVQEYIHALRLKLWNKSKDKKYYRMKMQNGGEKIVCMPKVQLEKMYSDRECVEIG